MEILLLTVSIVGANLRLGIHNGGLTMGYTHGISGGSGVLTGSTVDQLNFSANHQLGRIWSGQVNMGYAHNTPIEGFRQTSQDYNTWNFGGGVNRPLGRNATLRIAYNANCDKTTAIGGCVGANCSSNQTYQLCDHQFPVARPALCFAVTMEVSKLDTK